MRRLGEIIMNQKPLTPAELAKAKASHAVREAQKKEQQVKRSVGIDRIEDEANQAAKGAAADHSNNLDVQASLPPSLLAKVGRNEKLTTNEQKELASFFRMVGWL